MNSKSLILIVAVIVALMFADGSASGQCVNGVCPKPTVEPLAVDETENTTPDLGKPKTAPPQLTTPPPQTPQFIAPPGVDGLEGGGGNEVAPFSAPPETRRRRCRPFRFFSFRR